MDMLEQRQQMVDRQLAARGIADSRLLNAFREVPREAFLPDDLVEFAYYDNPLPIGQGQTISQPYIVALTIDALQLNPQDRVLEIGTGSGYAAAVLSRMVKEVYTIERIEDLADLARARLGTLGYDNVRVLFGDGTLGWPEHAPFDGIAVAAAGPNVPHALQSQLAIGGRMVIPVGPEFAQLLARLTRESQESFTREDLSHVRFVPLIGEQGWPDHETGAAKAVAKPARDDHAIAKLVREVAEPIEDLNSPALDALISRIGDARVVLLGESSHGTSEFYRARARISQLLIEKAGFDFVAVEADWPDAARANDYVVDRPMLSKAQFAPFSRFPTWMWRNQEVSEFLNWMRAHNQAGTRERRVGFHGLDLYSMFTSMAVVLSYLDQVDEEAARVARQRYGALTPWQKDPAAYGQAVLVGKYQSSEEKVVDTLRDMLHRRLDYALKDGERFFDAFQNARVVANAERYYRAMYYGAAASWNLRDAHMFGTLHSLLQFYGPESRGIVWEHNSHVGNAAATEMSARGELNVGQLCREEFGDHVYSIGFGTDHGTVAAASNWDAPMQRMRVRSALPGSYERLFHDSAVPAFTLHLRAPVREEIRDELMTPRLERAIGVIYRPETERQSHYFQAVLPEQFDEFIWFDETEAIAPLGVATRPAVDLPETYPFGL